MFNVKHKIVQALLAPADNQQPVAYECFSVAGVTRP
jgi:hypothetical protein